MERAIPLARSIARCVCVVLILCVSDLTKTFEDAVNSTCLTLLVQTPSNSYS